MPALQLAGIRQFIGGVLMLAFFYSKEAQRQTVKTIIILSILNFVLSNGLSTGCEIY
jgi:hypothetical protein